jgi:hypothetical protein
MRALEAYCMAGDVLPPSPLINLVDQLTADLETAKKAHIKLRH